MKKEVSDIVSELDKISADAKNTFGALTPNQINWKPSAEGWSVGQCFEHLIKTDSLFYDELEKIADGTRKNSFFESYSPLSSFFGNLLIKSLRKDERKFKAPTQKIVPPSEVAEDIIEQFVRHQAIVAEKIRRTENADWQRTVITSPFMKLMTYKLADGYQIIVEHAKRHVRQAERVIKMENFPKN